MKIIAEIGSNWKTLDDCLHSIRNAKISGADAVKFQLFDYKSLYGQDSPLKDFPYGDFPGSLPVDWLPQLKEQAQLVGIEFMCSAFSPELAEVVDPYVKTHKIASSEMNHLRLLQNINSFKKPVYLSCGASQLSEIIHSTNVLKDCPVTVMYCIASYPARQTDLFKITRLKEHFESVGFSDHSLEVYTNPLGAMSYGAEVIEKHVTFIKEETPDSPHSLNEKEFRLMCDAIHGDMNNYIYPVSEEKDIISRHRRRLIATQDIKQGSKFIEGVNFGIYRSLKDEAHAYTPFHIDNVIGKTALKDIKAGDGVGPGDI